MAILKKKQKYFANRGLIKDYYSKLDIKSENIDDLFTGIKNIGRRKFYYICNDKNKKFDFDTFTSLAKVLNKQFYNEKDHKTITPDELIKEEIKIDETKKIFSLWTVEKDLDLKIYEDKFKVINNCKLNSESAKLIEKIFLYINSTNKLDKEKNNFDTDNFNNKIEELKLGADANEAIEELKNKHNILIHTNQIYLGVLGYEKEMLGPYEANAIAKSTLNFYRIFLISNGPNIDPEIHFNIDYPGHEINKIVTNNPLSFTINQNHETILKLIKDYYKDEIGKRLPIKFEDFLYKIVKKSNYVPMDYDDWLSVKNNEYNECYNKVINNIRFFNYLNWGASSSDSELKQDSPQNKNKSSREKWLKKRNAEWLIHENIELLINHFESIDEVTELILTGGVKLTEALNKSRPITLDDI